MFPLPVSFVYTYSNHLKPGKVGTDNNSLLISLANITHGWWTRLQLCTKRGVFASDRMLSWSPLAPRLYDLQLKISVLLLGKNMQLYCGFLYLLQYFIWYFPLLYLEKNCISKTASNCQFPNGMELCFSLKHLQKSVYFQ